MPPNPRPLWRRRGVGTEFDAGPSQLRQSRQRHPAAPLPVGYGEVRSLLRSSRRWPARHLAGRVQVHRPRFQALPGRGEVNHLTVDGHPLTVIDDAYNANPESMTALIKNLYELGGDQGRKILILGEMKELPEWAIHSEQHIRETREKEKAADGFLSR